MSFEEFSPYANAALFTLAAIAVWIAGTKLARFADAIAEQTGLGREMLGILLLGGVTSLPELAVATTATFRGVPALSVADVLGSAAINLVVLAVGDAVIGKRALTSMQGSSGVMLQGVLGILLFGIAAIPAVAGDRLWLGMGITSWVMLVSYLAAVRLLSSTNAPSAWRAVGHTAYESDDDEDKLRKLRPLILKTIAAALVILIAGYLLARSGETLAEQTGLGTSFFGAVFLALSTSLPEWSTVISAVRLRRYEMAISDVFGTNLFNATIIVVVDALHPGGPVLLEAGRMAAFGALLALALTAVFLIGMLERRDRTIFRLGWDSLAILGMYGGGLVVLHALR